MDSARAHSSIVDAGHAQSELANSDRKHSSMLKTSSAILLSPRLSSSFDRWGNMQLESKTVRNFAAARSHLQQHFQSKFARDVITSHRHRQHKVPLSLMSLSLDTWGSRDMQLPTLGLASEAGARLRLSDPTFFGTHAFLLQSMQVCLLLSFLILGFVCVFRSTRNHDKQQLQLTVGDEQQLSKANQLDSSDTRLPKVFNFNVIFNLLLSCLCARRCRKRSNSNGEKPRDGLSEWWKDGTQPSADGPSKAEAPQQAPRKAAMCVFQGVSVGGPKASCQDTYMQSPLTPESPIPGSPVASTVEKVEFFSFYNDESDGESIASDPDDGRPSGVPRPSTPMFGSDLDDDAAVDAPSPKKPVAAPPSTPPGAILDHMPLQWKGEKVSMVKHPEIMTDLPCLTK